MNALVKEIIALEWVLFDRVENRGGRAPCQDDKGMFAAMRASQLAAWSRELLESYAQDLREAEAEGRNPLGEKYGYMMERTNPGEYAQIKDILPPRTPEKETLIHWITENHVLWQEDLARRYPRLTGRGRGIRKSADSPHTTSFETYLWGELATYSLRTLELYAAHVEYLRKEGRSMNQMILEHTVAQYGYDSLEAAERQLSGGAV